MKFLIERMDRHHEILRDEMEQLREKLDVLNGLTNKAVGAAMVVSGIVTAFFQYLIGGK